MYSLKDQICLTGIHVFFLSNAAYNIVYNFPTEDVAKSPVFFRLAQMTNILFSVCAAQIARHMGPLRNPTDDSVPQAMLAAVTGIIYSALTATGALASDSWAEGLRDTDSFRYMRSSVVLSLQALFATVFLQEMAHFVDAIVYMTRPRIAATPAGARSER